MLFSSARSKSRERRHCELAPARSAVLRYGLAVAAVAAATLIAVSLRPLSNATPFLCFYPAVIFAVWFGGLRPGLVATLLSSLAANYYLLSLADRFSRDLPGLIRTTFFTAALVGICFLAQLARRQAHSIIRVQSQLLDAAFEPIIMRDAEERIIYWNAGAEQLYGWTAGEAVGQSVHALLKTEFPQPLAEVLCSLRKNGRWQGELTHTARDGKTILVASSWTLHANGKETHTLQTNFDLTELRKTQDVLRQGVRELADSTETLRTAEKAADLGVWSWDLGKEEMNWTNQCKALFGLPASQPVTYQVFLNALHADDRESTDVAVRQAIQQKADYDTEYRVIWPDGSTHWIIGKGRVVLGESGSVALMSGICVDITERKRAEQALRQSEDTLRTIFNSGYDAILVHRPDGSILDVNERFLDMYRVQRDDVAHLTVTDISSAESPIDTLPEIWPKVLAGESRLFEWRARRPHDGFEFPVEVVLSRILLQGGDEAVLANVRDVTERKRVEEEKRLLQIDLAHAQKMEAIGQMAGGVAHDFNNLLNVISGYSELGLGNPDRALDSLTQIRKAAKTATAVTRQLLAFSRKNALEPKTIDVCEVMRETAAMLPQLLGEHIEIRTDASPEPCAAKMALGQLEQVIMNLAVNARDAMPHGGTLTVKVSTSVVDEANAARLDGLAPGNYVLCSVTDTGHGVPTDLLPRIFEPFFTTKGSGKGTGLGLATVRGIVNRSGGGIFIDSVVGRGTTFTFYLPLVGEAPPSVPPVSEIPAVVSRGSETILLVDDSVALTEMTKTFLQTRGYTVHTASNGVEALRVLARYGAEIDLLFTDVVMPFMNGPELARQVRQLRPRIKVLFASGSVGNLLERHGMRPELGRFIAKPYSFERLSSTIREVFDAPPMPVEDGVALAGAGK